MSTVMNDLFKQASHVIPGGVNSPVRAFKGVGGTPLFFKEGKGAYLIDETNKSYIDYVGSWGPAILGHAHPEVVARVIEAVKKGLSFGAPTAIEIRLAEKITEIMPAIEKVRMVNSGTEATMSAIRLARGFTGKNKIIKFEGCYHGHADSLLVAAGSGALTLGIPNSAGVPASFAEHTLVADYNRLSSVASLFEKYGNDIAAIIVEPVAGNMNCVLPKEGFLKGLRDLCDQYGALLIFDEVMTGFRIALGGACERLGIKPDLVTLGKIIGGGMPVGAFGGRRDIMDCVAPLGPVYQAGTLSGNPIAMTAGLATLECIQHSPEFYSVLEEKAQRLMDGFKQAASKQGIPFLTYVVGGMFGFYFTERNVIETYDDVKQSDVERFKSFFHGMLNQGIYLAPSAFEAGFISMAHSEQEIERTIQAADQVFLSFS